MNDTDNANIHTETLQQQFTNIVPLTNQSTVCQYGDLTIAQQPLSNYMAMNSFERVRREAHHGSNGRLHASPVTRRYSCVLCAALFCPVLVS